jgi:hypothetical protein
VRHQWKMIKGSEIYDWSKGGNLPRAYYNWRCSYCQAMLHRHERNPITKDPKNIENWEDHPEFPTCHQIIMEEALH